jgi:hypothetical protein
MSLVAETRVDSRDRRFSGLDVADVQHMLEEAAESFLDFLRTYRWDNPEEQYEVFETRFLQFKKVTERVDAQLMHRAPDKLRELRSWWRRKSDEFFMHGGLCLRARAWPEGYPGDYVTLEGIYQKTPWARDVLGSIMDRYFLTRTLAIAVRCRLRKLVSLLHERDRVEPEPANWLNLACGPCRELLDVPCNDQRTIWCVDQDRDSLEYARKSLAHLDRGTERIEFVNENAFRFVKSERSVERYGRFTTIYSTGLFDYIETEKLIKLLRGLYETLTDDGVLIATFKDRECYDTFDYHWFTKWDAFFQRTLAEFYEILERAGIPSEKMELERDDSGVILFFTCRR